jgi:hypothetical protein
VMKMSVSDLSMVVTHKPDAPVNHGTLAGIVHSALRQDLEMSPREQRPAILQRVRSTKTREQARQYLAEVQTKVRKYRTVPQK